MFLEGLQAPDVSIFCCKFDCTLSEARSSLEQIHLELQACQTQHSSLNKKLKTEKAVNSASFPAEFCIH